MSRMRCRVVLFDLFDTLCRIDPEVYEAGKAAEADLLGVPVGEFVRAWVAAGDDAQAGRIPDVAGRVRRTAATLRIVPPDDETVGRVLLIERDTLVRATDLHPDVVPTLQALRATGAPMGLVSNASSGAPALFEALGLGPYFRALTWSFQVGAVKPEPAIYHAACAAHDVAPEDCVFVGDGNALELDGARAVGMRAVRIERAFSLSVYRREESRSFDRSIADLRLLPDLIEPRPAS